MFSSQNGLHTDINRFKHFGLSQQQEVELQNTVSRLVFAEVQRQLTIINNNNFNLIGTGGNGNGQESGVGGNVKGNNGKIKRGKIGKSKNLQGQQVESEGAESDSMMISSFVNNMNMNNQGNVNFFNGKLFPAVKILPATKQLRILVTGGAGFVGSHLVDRLMLAGHSVVVLDNFFTGRLENIFHWQGHKNFRLIHHDVVLPILLEIDQIYHLACPASPPHYQYNPIKTIKTSVEGTLNMLGLAKRTRARILLASTSEIYGDPLEHPQKETYFGNVNTIGPRACYDEGKRVAETMMSSYNRQEGVAIRIARIFNTFGPRMHPNDGRVVSNFIIQALQNKPITVYGSGAQTRSFQYVDDLVQGLISLMEGNYSKPVNLGNPQEFTIKDFAQVIRDLVYEVQKERILQENNESSAALKLKQLKKVEIKFLKGTEDDPRKRKPDITVAKDQLGWVPSVDVRVGLRRTVEYFTEQLKMTGEFNPILPQELRDDT